MASIDFKIVILGDASVGKSSIVLRLLQNRFVEASESTIGAAFSTYKTTINDKPMRFEIWDTAGQERYNSIAPLYYRKAHVAIIVYDLSEITTLEKAKKWVRELKQNNETNLYILVANKYDLINNNMHPFILEGKSYADSQNMIFFVVSAKSGLNVMELFNDIAKNMEPIIENIKLKKEKLLVYNETEQNKSFCC
jgi:small GTP-binding protein